jgi:hypothetical protein
MRNTAQSPLPAIPYENYAPRSILVRETKRWHFMNKLRVMAEMRGRK